MTGSARVGVGFAHCAPNVKIPFLMRIFPPILLSIVTVMVTLPLPAIGRGDDARRERAAERERMPESVRRIENETGGRVLQVRPMQRGDREIYRVKVLTPEGRVRVMQDDPRRQMRDQPVPQPPPSRDDG